MVQHEGVSYSWDYAMRSEWACVIAGQDVSCYDTQAEADRAARLGLDEAQLDQMGMLASCTPGLTVWTGTSQTGGSATFLQIGTWFNLPSGLNNQVSSWRTGCRPGRLSDGADGGGSQLSLPAYSVQNTMPPGWDNRASAAYRS